MSWWGALFGGTFGYMLGGPLGALIGAALGRNFDAKLERATSPGGLGSERERIQTAFFTATFSVMGHLAKADGRVSEHEVRMAEAVMQQMQLNSMLQRLAKKLFREGRQPGFVLDDVLDQFKRECRHRQTLLRVFMEIQLQAAYADGVLHPAERKMLLYICTHLGFSQAEFEQLEAIVRGGAAGAGPRRAGQGMGLDQAYVVLGVSEDNSNDEIKKAYRRLMSQHHPDKLVSKGLPEEMMKVATQKTHEIRTAYEQIREARGF